MAVGIRIKVPGMNAEQFDKLEAAVGTRENHPDGFIFRAAGPIDDGWGLLRFFARSVSSPTSRTDRRSSRPCPATP
jgi:hypothetical protein